MLELPKKKYKTILIDPPWEIKVMENWKRRLNTKKEIPYKTMTFDELEGLPIDKISDKGCHLWLWTTNQTLPLGFKLLDKWNFKYLSPIT